MDSIVKQKSARFAARIIRMSKYLVDEKKEFVLSKQVLRSGTSIMQIWPKRNAHKVEKIFLQSIISHTRNVQKLCHGWKC